MEKLLAAWRLWTSLCVDVEPGLFARACVVAHGLQLDVAALNAVGWAGESPSWPAMFDRAAVAEVELATPHPAPSSRDSSLPQLPHPAIPVVQMHGAFHPSILAEDVFLDESILAEDEAALLMLQCDEALTSRLAQWKRTTIPTNLAARCSCAVDNVISLFYARMVCFPRIIVVLSISAAATNRIGYLLLKRWLYMPSFMMVSLQEVSGSSPTEVQNFW
ncbi:hypothetical protein ZEAMMB73_Zm00001d052046 [Zea mays]|uniref:Uncharacterized protein n=1 Tax=Zea mays TaxID=4577 RepID=A0A1D6QCC5_MAIZE|nr:hypothetical protein ZEAMMB73_Zm00001d052046 [Zea mays]